MPRAKLIFKIGCLRHFRFDGLIINRDSFETSLCRTQFLVANRNRQDQVPMAHDVRGLTLSRIQVNSFMYALYTIMKRIGYVL